MPLNKEFEFLVCPKDKGALESAGHELVCMQCGAHYPVKGGIPEFYVADNWDQQYLTDKDYYASEVLFSLEGDTSYLELCDGQVGVVLDLGAGDGVYASAAPSLAKVYCVDVTPTALSRIFQRGMANLIPVAASGYELPFADNSIDTILFVFVVEHLVSGKDLEMMREARRVLKPGTGRMIFVTDTPFFDRYLVRWTNLLLRGKWTKPDHESSTGHINLMTMAKSRELIHNANFNIIAEYPFWMGERFVLWRLFSSLLKTLLNVSKVEDYLTSKYAFILKTDKK